GAGRARRATDLGSGRQRAAVGGRRGGARRGAPRARRRMTLSIVPEVGLEPTLPRGKGLLRPPSLPFLHSGNRTAGAVHTFPVTRGTGRGQAPRVPRMVTESGANAKRRSATGAPRPQTGLASALPAARAGARASGRAHVTRAGGRGRGRAGLAGR